MGVINADQLFAWGPFAHGAMLWWGAAALIPLVIHLLSRRRYGDSDWAAMQFLVAAMKKHARRLRVEQLLLLLSRMALLLVLAAALAEPLLRTVGTSPEATSDSHTHWVLVFDVSYSMAYKPADKNLVELCQEAARGLLNAARQGDGFTLVLMGSPTHVVIRDPAFDAADVLREINRLEPRHGGASLAGALDEVKTIVQQARNRHPRLTTTRVCFLTDLGQATWEELETPSARRVIGELAGNVKLHLMEVGDPVWTNAAITRLELADPLVTPGRDAPFVAEVRRLSSDLPARARAVALVDGVAIHEEELDLTSGAEIVTFTHRFSSPGEHAVELKLVAADPLDVDNHRWLSVRVRESLKTLCIEGRPGAARFVAMALEPRRLDAPRLRWEIAAPDALLDKELSDYECVFLCNVPRFRAEEVEALARYARGGGGLVFFLGDLVESNQYNAHLLATEGKPGLLPARLGEIVSNGVHHLDPLDYRHPLVQPFRAHERSGLLTVPVQRYVRLDIADIAGTRVALGLDNGDPILVEHDFERGRVFLFGSSVSPVPNGTAASEAWNEFPSWPSFPPVIQELATLVLHHGDARRDATVGEVIEGIDGSGAASGRVVLRDPRGESEWLEVRAEERPSDRERGPSEPRWLYGPTVWSGVYQVARDVELRDSQLYTVNVDPAEGVLDRIDPASLPSQFERGLPATDFAEDTREGSAGGGRRSLARPLLAVLFGLLLLEGYLACAFGSVRS